MYVQLFFFFTYITTLTNATTDFLLPTRNSNARQTEKTAAAAAHPTVRVVGTWSIHTSTQQHDTAPNARMILFDISARRTVRAMVRV